MSGQGDVLALYLDPDDPRAAPPAGYGYRLPALPPAPACIECDVELDDPEARYCAACDPESEAP